MVSLHVAIFFMQHWGRRGWPRQLVAWVAQQQEEALSKRLDIHDLRPDQQTWSVSEKINGFL
jgi:hypothetical protein